MSLLHRIEEFRDWLSMGNFQSITNPLVWWRDSEDAKQFESLYDVAKMLLAVQATSCDSEREWSLAKRILKDHQGISPVALKQLVVISSFMTAFPMHEEDIAAIAQSLKTLINL